MTEFNDSCLIVDVPTAFDMNAETKLNFERYAKNAKKPLLGPVPADDLLNAFLSDSGSDKHRNIGAVESSDIEAPTDLGYAALFIDVNPEPEGDDFLRDAPIVKDIRSHPGLNGLNSRSVLSLRCPELRRLSFFMLAHAFKDENAHSSNFESKLAP
ncbi:hypothetical protein A0H81_08712 [Grifola frondosa]|uniref:Uncharacterized protein n=1 Tax=Grifola frondosa TaxID=5627 RepID=A0A1C7M2Y1_GRIFR|nr:hypothetical protein A0H81_08712 [Grifola frondosa]